MAWVVREVEFNVLFGEFYGLGRRIDAMYEFSTATHSIERETTRIAEHVEHSLAFGVFLQKRTILALVNEETRLLALQPVNTEPQSVFRSNVLPAAS